MLLPSMLMALLAQGTTVDGAKVSELRFHRVHLRNGNFIDGELVRQNTKEIVLRLKSGEMGVRRDQIVKVELIKMKGIEDKPEEVARPKTPPLSAEAALPAPPPAAPRKAAPPRRPAEGAYKASAELKAKVDPILEQLGAAAQDDVAAHIRSLVEMDGDAHAYLASQLEVASKTMLPLIGTVLGRTRSPAAAPYLARLLKHENPLVRLQAIVGLASNGEASDAEAVARALKDKDEAVRAAAVDTLSSIGEADAFDVIAPLSVDPDGQTRSRALTALATLSRKHDLREALVRTLSEALQEAAVDRVPDLIGALANTKDAQACPALAAHLGSDRPEIRAAAASGLGTIGHSDSADEIEARVGREEDSKVRIALAEAAPKVKARGAMAGLAAWLDDESELVKKAAHNALRALSNTDRGLEREKWEAWIEANNKK